MLYPQLTTSCSDSGTKSRGMVLLCVRLGIVKSILEALNRNCILDVVAETTAHLHNSPKVLLADSNTICVFLFSLVLSQSKRSLHGVADLSAVPFETADILAVPDELSSCIGNVNPAVRVIAQTVKTVGPDALTIFVAEALIVQSDMDATQKRAIKGLNPVGSKEENSTIVFERAEEDGNKPVSHDVLGTTALEVDVGFVQQDKSTITLAEFEEVAKIGLDGVRINTEVATGLDSHFDFIIKNKVLEGFFITLHRLQIGDTQVTPAPVAKNKAGHRLAAQKVKELVFRGRVSGWVEVLEAAIWALRILAWAIFHASIASTARKVSGQMVFDRRCRFTVSPRAIVAVSTKAVWSLVVEVVKARSITDDATGHEAGWSTAMSVARTRVDELAFVVHVSRALQKLPVQLPKCDILFSHCHSALGFEILGPEHGGDDRKTSYGLLPEPLGEVEAGHEAIDLGAIGLKHPTMDSVDIIGIAVPLIYADAADDVRGPDVMPFGINNLAWLQQKPKEIKGCFRGSQLMALCFTTDILAKVLIQKLEKNIDMLSGGGCVFWAVG
ncbi:hypothetical protein HG530_004308 [Fusarium avenaceum]|nr:hypothetical protein HG530_004308 [Fusarium avenaceum]